MGGNQPFDGSLVQNLTMDQLDEWAAFYAQQQSEVKNIWTSPRWLQFKVDGEQLILSMDGLDEVSTVILLLLLQACMR